MQPRDTPWFRIFGEGAVIVGSILLAFALDAWWDERNREQALKAQQGAVLDELKSTYASLGNVQMAHDLNVRLTESLRASLAMVPDGETVVIADEDLGPLLPQVTADVTTGTLNAFIAAGGLDIIDNANVRRELLGWSARIDDLLDDEVYLRNFAAADLAAYLRANADVANAESWSIAMVRNRFGVGPAPDQNALGTVTLRREQLLLNLLAARESGERSVSANLEDLRAGAERIILAMEPAG
jgi:hypothetical protein